MCKYRVPKVDPVGFFVYSVVRRLAACTARCRADCVSVRFELRLAGCAAGSSFLARSRVNQKKRVRSASRFLLSYLWFPKRERERGSSSSRILGFLDIPELEFCCRHSANFWLWFESCRTMLLGKQAGVEQGKPFSGSSPRERFSQYRLSWVRTSSASVSNVSDLGGERSFSAPRLSLPWTNVIFLSLCRM
jgi:hypothetical protein